VRQLVDGEVDSADNGWYCETKLKEALVEGTIGQATAMLQSGQKFPGCGSDYKFAM
jgi:hypothetical protein